MAANSASSLASCNVRLESTMIVPPPYKRVILKLSGESFVPPGQRGISMEEVVDIAGQTYRAAQLGVQIGDRDRRRQHLARGAVHGRQFAASRKRRPTTWACWPR